MYRYKSEGYDIKSLRTSQKILHANPKHNGANKTAAELLYTHNVLSDAYRYVTKVEDHDARSLEILGAVYQNAGELEKAIDVYERSYAKEPKKDLLRAMVVCTMGAKKEKDMNNYLKRLSHIDPLLSTKLIYALETKNGVKHGFLDTFTYLAKVEFFEGYCKVAGCEEISVEKKEN